jgi:hypothetical protein
MNESDVEEARTCKLAILEALLRGRHFDGVVVMRALMGIMANFMAVFIETIEEPHLTKEGCVTLEEPRLTKEACVAFQMEELRTLIDEKCEEYGHIGDLTVEMNEPSSDVDQSDAQTRSCALAILDVVEGGQFNAPQVMTGLTETMAEFIAMFIETGIPLGLTKEEFIKRNIEDLRRRIGYECEQYRRYRARH